MRFLILLFILLFPSISSSQQCGTERWLVKNLADADTALINFPCIMESSVEDQATMPRAWVGDTEPRRSDERTVYRIVATLTHYKLESDGDIHLILKGSDSTMVVEIPNPDCPEVAATSRAPLYREMRKWIIANVGTPVKSYFKLANRIVTITGIGYYDQYHGQKGMARNCREIHPVLSIK